jgi:site-specific DNA-methyltransferase (adenine-specific)
MILVGDCRARLRELDTESVDSIVTDPPYELGFMGKSWDASGIAYDLDVWRECLRVLKPGGHLLAFGAPRTYHRLACAIEDAGLTLRECLMWIFGAGFPKSHNLDGAWKGWGTALKPAYEPIVMARKPLRGTVAQNVMAYGTGAINVDGCRVGTQGGTRADDKPKYQDGMFKGIGGKVTITQLDAGRWPANVIHDGSEEVVGMFPDVGKSTGGLTPGVGSKTRPATWSFGNTLGAGAGGYGDSGSAARFFYSAKASKADRDEGMEAWDDRTFNRVNPGGLENDPRWAPVERKNVHPTVKPTDLMRYLVRLVTPPGGLVLDPFTGSGSTGKAAVLEGMRFIGCELSPEYAAIAEARIKAAAVKTGQVFEIPASPAPGRKADGEQLRLFA